MPRLKKRNLHLASIAPLGGMAKHFKSILPMEPEEGAEAFLDFSDEERENNSQWEVDESGDSDASSSDDDEPRV